MLSNILLWIVSNLKKRQYYKEERDTINCTNWHDDGAISQTASPQRFLMALHLVRHTIKRKLGKESYGIPSARMWNALCMHEFGSIFRPL